MVGVSWVLVAVFFGALFAILGLWQGAIHRSLKREKIDEIREARETGSDRPIAQHPQIQPSLCIGCSSCIRACPEEDVMGLVDGIAHVIHGSRCIGHGRCEEACPVGAITVGLGDLTERPDIPILSDNLETTQNGIYIAGELGGFALIRNAIEQGVKSVRAIAERVRTEPAASSPDALDLLIVGAGPAGFAASLEATAKKLDYRTISQDDLGGTVRQYPRRKLTMTQPVRLPLYGSLRRYEIRKEELVGLWDEIATKYSLKIKTGVRLLSLERDVDCIVAETSAGSIRSRFVLLALGRRGTPRKLGVPGEDSEKVFYGLIDAATYQNEHLLVVGGGDSAIEAATALASQPGNVVTLSYRKASFFRIKSRNRDRVQEFSESGRLHLLYSSNLKSIEPDSVLLKLEGDEAVDREYSDGDERLLRIPNNQVFIFAGGVPPFALLKDMGVGFGGTPQTKKPEKPKAERVFEKV